MLVGIEPEKERREIVSPKNHRRSCARTVVPRSNRRGVAKHRSWGRVGEWRETRYEPPHDTSPAMLVDPRYSIETEHYSFIVSPLRPRVCVCVCMVYSCCLMAHEDFVVCQLRHLQRAFGRHANTHASRIVRKGIVILYVVDLGVVKSTGCSEC